LQERRAVAIIRRVKAFLATVGLLTLRAPAPPRVIVRGRSWRAALADALVSTQLHAALIALGIVVRVVRYASDRSLWLDEAYLALNLMNRSYSGLLGTLDFGQGAPAGFLLLEKLALDVLGDSEHALRLLPFLAGVASLFLFYGIARRLLTPVAVPLALFLFAVGWPFVLYAGMVKQYSVDVAVALALFYLFLRVVDRPRFGVQSAVILALAGAAAVWLSYPAAFVLAGVGAGAVAVMFLRGDRRGLLALGIPFAAWLASFGAMFVLTLGEAEELAGATGWYTSLHGSPPRNVYVMFRDSNLRLLHWAADGLAPVLALLGAVSLWANPRQRPRLVVGGTMLAATLAAGYLGKYPAGQRFILFLVPFGLLCLAEGAVRVFRALPRDLAATFALVVGAVVLAPPLKDAGRNLVRPPKPEDVKPVLAYLADRWQDGDTLYVSSRAQYALRYYLECSDCAGVPARLRAVLQVRPRSGPAQTTPALVSETPQVLIETPQALVVDEQRATNINRLAGRDRVWALFTHYFPLTEEGVLKPLGQLGLQHECSPVHGKAFACLYDLAPRPGDRTRLMG
jgi:Dolichyl-phosphate-mannose-protein mannosyltransferase